MNPETRVCQNCKNSFVIDPQDFDFYEKIGVPAPTFCPPCRFQRRLAWINTFILYKRPCDLCKKAMVSIYAPDVPYAIYCPECWWSDNWDQYQYAQTYDSTRSFLEQFNELLHKAPLLGLSIDIPTSKDSPYTNNASNLKNCYLLYLSTACEDSAYGFYVLSSKSLLDSSVCMQTEWLYDSMHSWKCNRCAGSRSYVIESFDSYFLKDCVNCQNCFACASIKNKKYCAFNQQLTKEEYVKKLAAYDFGSYAGYQKAQQEAEAFWKTQLPKAEFGDRNADCWGAHIYDSRNVKDSFQVNDAENCRYVQIIDPPKNSDLYDVTDGGDNHSLSYEASAVGMQSSELKFSHECGIGDIDLEYCKLVTRSSHCFGCVGMKKAERCILNKQYSKEDYEKLAAQIRHDMTTNSYKDKKGRVYRYGEFFPIEFSPFAYNETLAQEFFPLTREGAAEAGCRWKNEKKNEYAVTVTANALPDHIKDAPDSITNEVIECASCRRGFKIIPMELSFLRQMNVPLPRQCPFCRIKKQFRLWLKNMEQRERTCAECGAAIITKYTESEAPRVLCRTCYQKTL